MATKVSNPFVLIEDLCFGYEKCPVLNGFSLSLQAGEIVSLIGGSGSGKTTLLKLVSGLLPAQRGSIFIADEAMPKAKSQTAFMMQQDLLLPWRTVLRNVTLAAEMGNDPSNSLEEEARQLLHDLDLSHCEGLFPDSLSGGMRHRVALARVLLMRRPLLLLDEPFASLDVLLREQLYHQLRRLATQSGVTVFLVTHDFRDALILSDRILCLSDGCVAQQWTLPPNLQEDAKMLGEWQERLRNGLVEAKNH